MNHEEAFAEVERSLSLLRQAADSMAVALPHIRKELDDAAEGRNKLDRTSSLLIEAESQISTIGTSLAGIESAIGGAMEAARAHVHDNKRPLETRLAMLKLCREVFRPLKAAGFEIQIPEIGEELSTDRHQVKGRTKSELGDGQVADVISWGYSFPSGAGQLAQVLVGDGSLAEGEETEPEPSAPTAKAGISMVLDDEQAAQPKKKKTAREGSSLFDSLAEAAERNREQDD